METEELINKSIQILEIRKLQSIYNMLIRQLNINLLMLSIKTIS